MKRLEFSNDLKSFSLVNSKVRAMFLSNEVNICFMKRGPNWTSFFGIIDTYRFKIDMSQVN